MNIIQIIQFDINNTNDHDAFMIDKQTKKQQKMIYCYKLMIMSECVTCVVRVK